MSSPSSRISPSARAPGITSCIRLSVRMNVDLPHPDGPMSAVTDFGSMVRVTSSMARNDPYQALTWLASMRFDIPSSLLRDKPVPAGDEAGGGIEDQHDRDQHE